KPGVDSLNIEINRMVRIYIKALREMETDKKFYPDANLTLRLTYGKVDDLYPRDAVHYDYFTTLDGVMEKDNPDIYDYAVPDKLKQLYSNKDFGNYAENGRMHVCFLASNHTTGGNSGSPVLNADGQLIGVNFDRNWEGTMSDLMYDPSQCRNISLDIRYALFIIDKFANAKYLLDEMKIIY
ncbi:MAG: S46 family peptidase, partial [Bacteroidota bacterium]|nr:S46 family peptidase [Bacteroidota bacterium]